MVAPPVETESMPGPASSSSGDDSAELSPGEIQLGARIGDAMMGLNRQWTAVTSQLARLGIDKTAMTLLTALTSVGPVRSNALAEAVYSDPSTISRQVAALVRDGLIERRADPVDGRASLLAVTGKGHELLQARRLQKSCSIARMVAHWPESDQEQFAELLERFVADHERNIPKIIDACAADAARTKGEN
jgi:DNA-binding MarR family transcriptional regulator